MSRPPIRYRDVSRSSVAGYRSRPETIICSPARSVCWLRAGCGGVAIAQDPADALHSAMPRVSNLYLDRAHALEGQAEAIVTAIQRLGSKSDEYAEPKP
jgi:hypothetical protein